MKSIRTISTFIVVGFLSCNNGDTNIPNTKLNEPFKGQALQLDTFRFSYVNSHANAQKLMKSAFLFDEADESAPFGSDAGSDAAYGFREWRAAHLNYSPNIYLNELRSRWGYPFFDPKELDSTKILAYINTPSIKNDVEVEQQMQILKEALKNSGDTSFKSMDDQKLREIVSETSKHMGSAFLVGLDNAIIGIGFAQFVMEGRIDREFKSLVDIALKRQLLPVVITRWDNDYIEVRKNKLAEMLSIIQKAGSR